MKNNKAQCGIFRKFRILCLMFTIHFALTSQTNQIGLRLGNLSGVSYRYTNEKKTSLEVTAQKWIPYYYGTTISILGEKSKDLKNNFSIYGGAGLFISTLRTDRYYAYRNGYYYKVVDTDSNWGIEGVGGIEYKFTNAPCLIGIDLRPRIWGGFYSNLSAGGINMRYIF